MSRRRLVPPSAPAMAAALALIPAGAFGGAQTASSHTVTLSNIRFRPATVNIHRGDSVRWVWRDGEIEHNVTFHRFQSRTQASGSYTVRFTHTGIFAYHCTIQVEEGMKGKIIVR